MYRLGRLIEVSLLALLKEEDAYGYKLMDKLIYYNLIEEDTNIGIIYRALRNLEKKELVKSYWEESNQGPKKRIYSITTKGLEVLKERLDLLKYRRSRIDTIIDLCSDLDNKGGKYAK